MYEIVTILSLLLIILLCVILVGTIRQLNTLRDSYTEFLVAYTKYVKAVGDTSEAMFESFKHLQSNLERSHLITAALAADVEYLEAQLEELKQFVEYQDKRLIGVEQNEIQR